MKTFHAIAGCLTTLFLWTESPVRAQESTPSPAPSAPAREALEKKFQESLRQATFVGRWSVVKDGKLGPQLEDKYTLQGVTKVGGDVWLVHARIQYGKIDTTVPVPVHVHWAGDTPVISLTDLAIPGVGTYTARVVVHGDLYAGTWSGGSHGGVMSGTIERTRPDPAAP